jgi:hypothetical protein
MGLLQLVFSLLVLSNSVYINYYLCKDNYKATIKLYVSVTDICDVSQGTSTLSLASWRFHRGLGMAVCHRGIRCVCVVNFIVALSADGVSACIPAIVVSVAIRCNLWYHRG